MDDTNPPLLIGPRSEFAPPSPPTKAQLRKAREAFCVAVIGVARPRNRRERRKVLHAIRAAKGKR